MERKKLVWDKKRQHEQIDGTIDFRWAGRNICAKKIIFRKENEGKEFMYHLLRNSAVRQSRTCGGREANH
jgi:hypothetical protein